MSNWIADEAHKEAVERSVYPDKSILVDGHGYNYYYQTGVLKLLTTDEIVAGIIYGFQRSACWQSHADYCADYWESDQCRHFMYPKHSGGGWDHFNMRWLKEWCQENNPKVLKVFNLKAFW